MKPITHSELEHTLHRARSGKDLGKRRVPPSRLDERFRRRNELMAKFHQHLAEKRKGERSQ